MTDKKLECFVISPIGSPGTAIRKEADWVLRKLIRPALGDSYNVVRADDFTKGEIITNRVITSIQNADLLVAVMSGHNPNVFYELAVAHAYSKPVVPLIKDGESIPFDVGLVGTIFYSHDDVNVWDAAIGDLRAAADATRVEGYKASNPITMALGAAKASASPDSSEQMVAKLTSELATMRSDIAQLSSLVFPEATHRVISSLANNWRRTAREYETRDDALLRNLQTWADNMNDEQFARLFESHVNAMERDFGRGLTLEERQNETAKFYGPRLGIGSKDDPATL